MKNKLSMKIVIGFRRRCLPAKKKEGEEKNFIRFCACFLYASECNLILN